MTSGSVSVDTGALSSTLVGKAMIIHAYDGSRIACALLSDGIGATLTSGAFVPYFSYSGGMSVAGSVSIGRPALAPSEESTAAGVSGGRGAAVPAVPGGGGAVV